MVGWFADWLGVPISAILHNFFVHLTRVLSLRIESNVEVLRVILIITDYFTSLLQVKYIPP